MLSSVSFVISVISFMLTIVTVIFTYRFNRITIRNSAKQEHQKILLEINKMLLAEPELWTVYDQHPMNAVTPKSPQLQAKVEALVYYYLNFFDVVYEFYNVHIIKNKNDLETWKSWAAYIEYFIRGSSAARNTILQMNAKLYEEGVYSFYYKIISEMEQERSGSSAAEPVA